MASRRVGVGAQCLRPRVMEGRSEYEPKHIIPLPHHLIISSSGVAELKYEIEKWNN
ncbi:MAG: hypothetical protein QNJ63_02315 [Calothrix sp. MO_192.B10]|nr:hypothetical protein [Calothrix sp. MO_192.B10]